MTEHPGDNADTRFRAFWAGILGFVSFGTVLVLALGAFGPDEEEAALSTMDLAVVEARKKNLKEVREAQAELVPADALKSAMAQSVSALAEKKPTKTELLVPNSPTFLEQMAAPSEEPDAEPAEDEPAAEAKPEDEKPAEPKPAEEKPAAEKKPEA